MAKVAAAAISCPVSKIFSACVDRNEGGKQRTVEVIRKGRVQGDSAMVLLQPASAAGVE